MALLKPKCYPQPLRSKLNVDAADDHRFAALASGFASTCTRPVQQPYILSTERKHFFWEECEPNQGKRQIPSQPRNWRDVYGQNPHSEVGNTNLGGRPKLDIDEAEVLHLFNRGWTVAAIARKAKVSRRSIGRILDRLTTAHKEISNAENI